MGKMVVISVRVIFYFAAITLSSIQSTYAESFEVDIHAMQHQAMHLMEKGEYRKACEVLKSIRETHYDPQLTFLKGKCRFGMRDYSAAAFQYQLMLDRQTNLPRVRTELARTLAAMGKNSAAKVEYEKVLSGNIPPVVRKNISAEMNSIDLRRRWGGLYSIGFLHDSNVNAAPASPNIDAFGLPFVLDSESTEQSDSALIGSISFGKYFDGPFGDEWRYDVYGNFLKYSSENEYDTFSAGVSLGPNFYNNSQVYLPFGINFSWEDGSRATQSASFKPSISKVLSDTQRLSGQLIFQYHDDLRKSDESNGWSNGINANYQHAFSQSSTLELGLSLLNNEANEFKYNQFVSKSISATWHSVFSNGVKYSVQPSYSMLSYESIDPVDVDTRRKDDRYGLSFNLYKEISVGGESVIPVLSFTWTKNNSSVKRREYERKQISLQFRKQF